MIEWGQKSIPKKIPRASNKTQKKSLELYSQNYATGIRGHYHESSDCFEYPKKSPLKSSDLKNTCQIFLPKKIPESKISNPKKSFDHPRHLKSVVHPPRNSCNAIMNSKAKHLGIYLINSVDKSNLSCFTS